MIKLISRKYFSEWANGTSFSSNTSDFATHLKGSVGEKVKFVATVNAALISVADQGNQFEAINGNTLRRQQGSWIDEGFAVGQTVSFIRDYTGLQSNNSPSVEWSGTIDAISDTEIDLTISSGTFAIGYKTDHAIVCTSKFPALIFHSAIVGNDDDANFVSPYSGDIQGFYYSSIDTTTPTTHQMTVIGGNSGSKTWKSGDATVKWVSSSNPFGLAVNYVHEYEITHEFVISPVFIEEYLQAYEGNIQPDNFLGELSVKHVTGYEFRAAMSNTNTSVKFTDSIMKGSVGWYDENYNGFTSGFTVSNVTYEDTESSEVVSGLQLSRKTTVKGRVNGSFSNTSKLGLYFHWCAPASIYSSKLSSFQDAFLWDSLIGTMVAGTYESTGAERIQRFKLTYVNATRVDFEADIQITNNEADQINPDLLEVVSDKYFIGIQAGNTNTTDTSNKVITRVDFAQFVINNDVENLIDILNPAFYDHGMDFDAGGFTDYKGWKQDGIIFKCTLVLNKFLNANLDSLKARLIAHNTTSGDSFEIQNYIFDLSNIVTVGTYQKLGYEIEREFNLVSGDEFKLISIDFKDPVGNYQNIDVVLSIKLDWQSWIKLANASGLFYDSTLDSNGMGKDASRYWLNDYEVKLQIEADVKQLDDNKTRYLFNSPKLEIYGWGLEDDDPAEWSVVFKTFDLNNNDVGGVILKNQDTKFIAEITPVGGDSSGFTNSWAVARLDKYLSSGYGIYELSSIKDYVKSGPLKPSIGEDFLKITNDGTKISLEGVIDYTKLSGDYNLSVRLSRTPTYPRYGIARDIKMLSEDEMLLFSCPDNGVATTNSFRIAQLDGNGFILSEARIALNGSYTYQNWKMVVSQTNVNGKPNIYAVTYTGAATEVHEFIFDGTTYNQTRIYSSNLGGGTYTCIRIDPVIGEVNSKPYLWIGNSQANIGGQRGFKHLYYNGASWTTSDWKCYNSASPANDQCQYPVDVIFDNTDVYVLNLDNPPQSNDWQRGKIAKYYQSTGSVLSTTDRGDFANYALVNNIIINSGDTENQDGAGNDADILGAVGFELIEVDANSNPVFLIVHDVTLGTDGARHFSRLRSTISSPNGPEDWVIETPMIATNTIYGATEKLTGKASASYASSPLQRKNQCHICIVNENEFITGQIKPYWTKHIINAWDGSVNNDWGVFTPIDPAFDFTNGDILKQ